MIIAVNAILECAATGLFTALALMLFIKLGWLPMLAFTIDDEEQQEEEL